MAKADCPRGRPGQWVCDYAAFLNILSSVEPVKSMRAGPLYGFPEETRSSANVVSINKENVGLLRHGLDEWVPDVEAKVPVAAVVSDNRAVSICASAILSQTTHCAGVETLPEYRGKGFGTQAVAAWAKQMRRKGAVPFYGTTFENVASQGLAARLCLQVLASEFTII